MGGFLPSRAEASQQRDFLTPAPERPAPESWKNILPLLDGDRRLIWLGPGAALLILIADIGCSPALLRARSRSSLSRKRWTQRRAGADGLQALQQVRPGAGGVFDAGLLSSTLRRAGQDGSGSVLGRIWDTATSVAGLSSSSTYRFPSQTLFIADCQAYSRSHDFKPSSLSLRDSDAEALKNHPYLSSCKTRGMAFAALACNSFGQRAPKLLSLQRTVAYRAATRCVFS